MFYSQRMKLIEEENDVLRYRVERLERAVGIDDKAKPKAPPRPDPRTNPCRSV